MAGRRGLLHVLFLSTITLVLTVGCNGKDKKPEDPKIVTLTTYHGTIHQDVDPETATATIKIESHRRRELRSESDPDYREPWGEPNIVPCAEGVEFSVRYYELDESTGSFDKSNPIHQEIVPVGKGGLLVVPFPPEVRKLGTTEKGCRVQFVSIEERPMPVQSGDRYFALKVRNEDLQKMWLIHGGR
jgi:hypothetical protein